jgi:magnesium chelatase accessory protein
MPLPPPDWPLREHSRLVSAAGCEWHLQQVGDGPDLLLVHGTGGSTHSWARAVPPLANRFRVTVVDLPGHGFTGVPSGGSGPDPFSLEGMAAALACSLRVIGVAPALVAGHSAGTAVLLRAVLDATLAPRAVVGFNPALIPPPDAYVRLVAPWLAPVFASGAMAASAAGLARALPVVDWLLASAGAPLNAETVSRYRALFRDPGHTRAALSMMARWDLPRLVRDAAALRVPLVVYAGARDRWVPADLLRRSVARIPGATLHVVPDAGHLIPEERPDAVVEALLALRPAA